MEIVERRNCYKGFVLLLIGCLFAPYTLINGAADLFCVGDEALEFFKINNKVNNQNFFEEVEELAKREDGWYQGLIKGEEEKKD